MLQLYIFGTSKENMTTFCDTVCESVTGWAPFVDDEFTVSSPEPYGDGEYLVSITIGETGTDDTVMCLNYDTMFFGREKFQELKGSSLRFED